MLPRSSADGPGAQLLAAARAGRFDLLISKHLLIEVRRTLIESFHKKTGDVDALIRLIEDLADSEEPPSVAAVSRDPDDDPILALAAHGRATFLATYDHDLMAVGQYGGCGVVHPIQALQLIRNQ